MRLTTTAKRTYRIHTNRHSVGIYKRDDGYVHNGNWNFRSITALLAAVKGWVQDDDAEFTITFNRKAD